MEIRERFLRLNGLSFHNVEWGPVGASPVVLLHGITGHARVWDRLAHTLLPMYRVVALDQRGHGDSGAAPDGDYQVPTMARDLAAFVDELGLKRFALLGHSMGGRVAIAYTALHPERVGRLIVVDIGPDIHPAGLQRVRGMMAATPEEIESEQWAIDSMRRANPLHDPDELRHRVVHGLRRRPDGTLTWKYDKGLRDMVREGRSDAVDLWEPLGAIMCPTLLVRGTESDILSAETAQRMLQTLRRAELVEVPNAGHFVPGDRPADFARVIQSFLSKGLD
jgi:pimeloyl-ACP methyl ester carboxylesterase